MIVFINGERTALPDNTTLRQLIERRGLGATACAAEVNKRLVPRKQHEETCLQDGDSVELVTLIGGG
jgi:sulfur carrier protein